MKSLYCKRELQCCDVILLLVFRNFSTLSPKLVLAYAENSLSDSRQKNCANCKSG